MSNIIKASQIIGEYRFSDHQMFQSVENKKSQEKKANRKIKETEKAEAILKAEKQAELIIAQAEKQVQKIKQEIDEKKAEVLAENKEKGYEQGYQDGKELGFQAGKKEGIQEVNTQLEVLESIVNKTKKELELTVNKLSDDVINLALSIASRIINANLKLKPELINNIVQELLDNMVDIQKVVIKVSPELIAYLEQSKLHERYANQNLKFLADENLNLGDCIVESELGGRDGTLASKLKLIESELFKGTDFDGEI